MLGNKKTNGVLVQNNMRNIPWKMILIYSCTKNRSFNVFDLSLKRYSVRKTNIIAMSITKPNKIWSVHYLKSQMCLKRTNCYYIWVRAVQSFQFR